MSLKGKYRSAVGLAETFNGEGVPCVVAQGSEFMADEIVRVARRYGIPVVEDGALAGALEELEIDEQIPPALYRSVALILARLKSVFNSTR